MHDLQKDVDLLSQMIEAKKRHMVTGFFNQAHANAYNFVAGIHPHADQVWRRAYFSHSIVGELLPEPKVESPMEKSRRESVQIMVDEFAYSLKCSKLPQVPGRLKLTLYNLHMAVKARTGRPFKHMWSSINSSRDFWAQSIYRMYLFKIITLDEALALCMELRANGACSVEFEEICKDIFEIKKKEWQCDQSAKAPGNYSVRTDYGRNSGQLLRSAESERGGNPGYIDAEIEL